jgi:uncharacterized protein
MPRLREGLADEEGWASVDLEFTLDDAKQKLISGRLQAEVNVLCQRCLKPLAIALADDIKLALLRDEDAAKALKPELDPWVCEDHKLDLAELIEEQLILCMPLVSYHDSGECMNRKNYISKGLDSEHEATATPTKSPFAALKSLKKSDLID